MDWQHTKILVTGGASFIGSHLVDHLVEKGASRIRVVDDLSSGRRENLATHLEAETASLRQIDLLAPGAAEEAVRGIDVVFHLAAIHGGRGFIDLNQASCSRNLALDSLLIRAAYEAGVDKLVFASSGCVYPASLQGDVEREVYLEEPMSGPPFEADGLYGWAKLMAEMTLTAYARDFAFRSAACRFFTVYGERATESHAVVAMIARALIRQDPFEVWGDGSQIRNWTYVGDIVRGMVLAAEKIDDGSAVNLGTEERIRVLDAVHEVLRYTGHQAEIRLLRQMPTGPLNRVASNRRAREVLGWEPQVSFVDGLHRTIDWYFATQEPEAVRCRLEHRLLERSA